MIRADILALTLLLTTCLVPTPTAPTPGLRYTVDLGECKGHEEDLRGLVQQRVDEHFGDVSGVETTVWWVQGHLRYEGKDYGGLTFSCSEIYVKDIGDLCYSSYIHELIHCYHTRVEGWRDMNHENKKWWDLVEPLKIECAKRGW